MPIQLNQSIWSEGATCTVFHLEGGIPGNPPPPQKNVLKIVMLSEVTNYKASLSSLIIGSPRNLEFQNISWRGEGRYAPDPSIDDSILS